MNTQQDKTRELNSEWFARNFFFSLTPDNWSFQQLLDFLYKFEESFDEMYDEQGDMPTVWEPFEDYKPSWVADQMGMMQAQLSMLYKEVV